MVAAVIGLLNAAPNVYWAFGGDFLLETVGMWLVDLHCCFRDRSGMAGWCGGPQWRRRRDPVLACGLSQVRQTASRGSLAGD